ncbi:hypothetical protein ACFSVM_09035 [Paenibacillus shunpengii]|uniref:TcpE family protein n=1 Tax=Paenibacillus shunpengii TaxID=2054424 RepID=A0ABW5SLG2_9BACL
MNKKKDQKSLLYMLKGDTPAEVPVKAKGKLNWTASFKLFKVYRQVRASKMLAPSLIILYFIFAQIMLLFFSIIMSVSLIPFFLLGILLWAILNKYLVWVLKETTIRTLIKEGYTPKGQEDQAYVDVLYL